MVEKDVIAYVHNYTHVFGLFLLADPIDRHLEILANLSCSLTFIDFIILADFIDKSKT